MQVVGGEVRPEVGAVAEDRAVLHQPVLQEELLAGADVVAGEQRLSGRVDDAVGDRRVGGVGAVGEEAEHRESDQHHQRSDLHPGPRHHH